MFSGYEYVLALITEAQTRALIEEHADALVRELVAETIFIRVVDPLGHPQEGLGAGQTRRVSSGWRKIKMLDNRRISTAY